MYVNIASAIAPMISWIGRYSVIPLVKEAFHGDIVSNILSHGRSDPVVAMFKLTSVRLVKVVL